MPRFKNQVLLLTGAGSGIGRATTLKLAAQGASLFVTDVAADALKETLELAADAASESGARIASSVTDISDEAQAKASVVACLDEFGKLDALCNNAGVIGYRHTHEMDFDFWRKILSVNLDGTFLMTREAIPHLLKTRGAIVNIGSTAGLSGLAYGSAYSASKGAVHAFTRAIAVEYASQGLRANSICPASIETGMTKPTAMPEGADFSLLERLSSLHGVSGPEAVADLILFLASEDARHISGEEIRIDGAALA
ncbi:SDR family oxidoreductase [Myxococcota bacterium]|jgi:NAD(P)-dependent dehydrogenase (short-subunit alcohol dehydrogenase family)|nr:SDR family oxidoreductase [Myxococcota bacterium]